MAGAKRVKTRWPRIYRRGDRWEYVWTDARGKPRSGTASTREEASARKAGGEAGRARPAERRGLAGRVTLAAYALDLFGADLERESGAAAERGRYQGRRGAIRENTQDEYRRDLERYWLPVLGRRPLGGIRAAELSTP